MRAFAIFIILFHHLPGHSYNYYDLHFFQINYDLSWLNHLNRYFALGIFFFISGFLTNRSGDLINDWKDVKKFLIKRYIRIIPLYIIALLIFISIFRDMIDNINSYSFIVHMLGLQSILASKYCDPVITLWFVGLIVSYYYLFVILAIFGRKSVLFIALLLSVPFISILLKYFFGLMDKRFIVYYGIFIAGILCQQYKLTDKIRWKHVKLIIILFLISIFSYTTIVYPKLINLSTKPALFSFTGMMGFILANSIMLSFTAISFFWARSISNTRYYDKIKRVAYASYCMFLFHRPIWWLMTQIYNPDIKIIKLFYLGILGVSLICVSSYYLQKVYDAYFEKRLIKLLT